MQVGIDSLAAAFDATSRAVNPAERLRQLAQQIEHTDQVGMDAFGVRPHKGGRSWAINLSEMETSVLERS